MQEDGWSRIVEGRIAENEDSLKKILECPLKEGEWTLRRISRDAFGSCTAPWRQLIKEGMPFIVESGGVELCPLLESSGGDAMKHLREVVGKKKVALEWRRGVDVVEKTVMSMEEALECIERCENKEECDDDDDDDVRPYVYDVSARASLVPLLQQWSLPVMVRHDYLHRTRLRHACQMSWPTLFVASSATCSATHVDRWCGHFWMQMVKGTKRWTIWSPRETPLLQPSWSRGTFDPHFPHVSTLRGVGHPIVLDLKEGEMLFVPGGSVHAVENLTLTIAWAGNFVDASNVDRVLKELSCTSTKYADDKQLLQALSEIEFDEDDDEYCKGDESVLYA